MGICNKIAGMLAPVLIGTVVLHGSGDLSASVAVADEATKAQLLNDFAAKIHAPYLAMAGLLVLLAVAVLFSPLPEIKSAEANATPTTAGAAERRRSFPFPHRGLGGLCRVV
ncbi:hypothetical protein G6F32_016931 [Rhizopus arrhizus]|nr:hypothetical protein G6F32_016931 [Rhizopus arrhizus]